MGNAPPVRGRGTRIHPDVDWRTVNGDTVFKVYQPLDDEQFEGNQNSYITRLGFNDTSERRQYNPSEIKLSDIRLTEGDDWENNPEPPPGLYREGALTHDVFVKVYGKKWKHPVGSVVRLINYEPLSDSELLAQGIDERLVRRRYGTKIIMLPDTPQLVDEVVENLTGGILVPHSSDPSYTPHFQGGRRRRRRSSHRHRHRKNLHTRRVRKHKQ